MGFINFFAQLFYNLRQLLAGPGRMITQLRYQLSLPFRMVGSAFRQLKMVRISRFIPRMPRPIRSLLEKIPGFGEGFKIRHEKGDIAELDIPDIEGVPFRPDRRTAEFSQIHLINTMTNRRHITHIGTDVGRSEAQLKLGETEFYFFRVNPKLYADAPLLVQARTNAKIKIDGNDLLPVTEEDSLTVKIGSIITIEKKVGKAYEVSEYRVELFAWDVLPEHTRVKAGWKTHVGPLHDHNEDAIGIYQHVLGYMFVVADGVGSMAAGEIASEFAVNYMLAAFHENIRYRFDWHEVLEMAAENINKTMRQRTRQSGIISNASLTAVVIQNWDAYVMHIGDTRLFHYGKDGLHQVTQEHKAEVEQSGLVRGQTVKRQILTQALGKDDHLHVDKLLLRLHPGDRLVLASDGIAAVPNEDLGKIVRKPDIIDVAPDAMTFAYANQSTDNVSIVAIEILPDNTTKDKWRAYPSQRVYAGYDPDLAFNFDPVHDFRTRHPLPVRRIGLWAIIIVALSGVFLFARMVNNNIVTDTGIPTATATRDATRVVEFTVQPPTATPQRTQQVVLPTATPFSIEPSSTLRPIPTATIAGAQ